MLAAGDGEDIKVMEGWLSRRFGDAMGVLRETLNLDSAAERSFRQVHESSSDALSGYTIKADGRKLIEIGYPLADHFARTVFDYAAELKRIFPSEPLSSSVTHENIVYGYALFLGADEKIRSELLKANTFANYALEMPDLAVQASRVTHVLRNDGLTHEYLLALRDVSMMLDNPETRLIGAQLFNLMITDGLDGETRYLLSFSEILEATRHDLSPWAKSLQTIVRRLPKNTDVEDTVNFFLSKTLKAQGVKIDPDDLDNALLDNALDDDSPLRGVISAALIRSRVNSTAVLLKHGEHRLAHRILNAMDEYWDEDYQTEKEITDPVERITGSNQYLDILLHRAAQLSSAGQFAGIGRSLLENALNVLEQGEMHANSEWSNVDHDPIEFLDGHMRDSVSFDEATETYLGPLLDPTETKWINAADKAGWNFDQYWDDYLKRKGPGKGGGPDGKSSPPEADTSDKSGNPFPAGGGATAASGAASGSSVSGLAEYTGETSGGANIEGAAHVHPATRGTAGRSQRRFGHTQLAGARAAIRTPQLRPILAPPARPTTVVR